MLEALTSATSKDLCALAVPREERETTVATPQRLKIITPPSGWQLINIGELWRHRELLFFFAWRDVKVRYKQTLLGAAWAVIQPLMMMVVFTAFLGRLAGADAMAVPYPLFVFVGLLPWMFFSSAIASAGNSVVSSESIITKIYFPRLLVPFAAVAATFVDCLCALGMLAVMLLYYGVWPGATLLLVPVVIVVTGLLALGIGTLLAALNVAYRDVKYVIPFLIQLWMFATPAIYIEANSGREHQAESISATASSAGTVVETSGAPHSSTSTLASFAKPLVHLNPMNPLVTFFRAAVLGRPLPWTELAGGLAVTIGALGLGMFYFRRVENTFADVI